MHTRAFAVLPSALSCCRAVPHHVMCVLRVILLQEPNKEGETPLGLAGDLAAALQEASSSGKVYTNGFDSMEH